MDAIGVLKPIKLWGLCVVELPVQHSITTHGLAMTMTIVAVATTILVTTA